MHDDINLNKEEKWRLILGKDADNDEVALNSTTLSMDSALEALYNSPSKGGLGDSSPKVNRWLGDIRKYFPSSVVQIMQKDALERLGLERMLLEPELLEHLEADIHLVSTLLSLNNVIPEKTKNTARKVVQKVVENLRKKLENPMREAVKGALSKAVKNRNPKFNEINWKLTIQRNLKHYQADYNSIIPHRLFGYGKKGQALKNIILCVDQSGSMASSLVYSSIYAAVLASISSIKTQMIVFDTNVVDLTKEIEDPVDLLFGTQLGGGTDINKALSYIQTIVSTPSDTILVLISDLYEGGNIQSLLQRAFQLKEQGINFICLLALNDDGAPIYDKQIAAHFSELNIPVFACTPDKFPDLMATCIKKESISSWMNHEGIDFK